jgi:hypothetical protein
LPFLKKRSELPLELFLKIFILQAILQYFTATKKNKIEKVTINLKKSLIIPNQILLKHI